MPRREKCLAWHCGRDRVESLTDGQRRHVPKELARADLRVCAYCGTVHDRDRAVVVGRLDYAKPLDPWVPIAA